MKLIDIEGEITATYFQSMWVTDEEYEKLKDNEGGSFKNYKHEKGIFEILDLKINFDYINEIKEISIDIIELLNENGTTE